MQELESDLLDEFMRRVPVPPVRDLLTKHHLDEVPERFDLLEGALAEAEHFDAAKVDIGLSLRRRHLEADLVSAWHLKVLEVHDLSVGEQQGVRADQRLLVL